jgi:hypothetical protein
MKSFTICFREKLRMDNERRAKNQARLPAGSILIESRRDTAPHGPKGLLGMPDF